MTRVALLFCLLNACSADREVVASGPDAGLEAGIAHDAAEDAGPYELAVEPANRALMIDTEVPRAQSVPYAVSLDGRDVTATSMFTVDDPGIATFAANVLTTEAPPPFTTIGKTFVVTAREGTKKGRAKLTLVRLRTTGEAKDLFFQSAHGLAPNPDKELFRVVTTAESGVGADVRVVLQNDPSNPPGIDARKLVTVRAMAEGAAKIEPPSCDPGQATKDGDGDGVADTFVASASPRALCFDVRPVTNVLVTAAESASFHRVLVDVVTSTGTTLQSRSIVVMVPASAPTPR